MVILHKDNSIYEVGEDLPTLSKSLHQFYYLKFEKILQKHARNYVRKPKVDRVHT